MKLIMTFWNGNHGNHYFHIMYCETLRLFFIVSTHMLRLFFIVLFCFWVFKFLSFRLQYPSLAFRKRFICIICLGIIYNHKLRLLLFKTFYTPFFHWTSRIYVFLQTLLKSSHTPRNHAMWIMYLCLLKRRDSHKLSYKDRNETVLAWIAMQVPIWNRHDASYGQKASTN